MNLHLNPQPLISRDEIARQVKRLGQSISQHYGSEPFKVLTLMHGAFMFVADLSRYLPPTAQLVFTKVSSYGKSTESSGTVTLENHQNDRWTDEKILVVDDIIDSGRTLQAVCQLLQNQGAAEVKTCAMFDKPSRRTTSMECDWVGVTIEDRFVVGYGLDFAEQYRQLPDLHEMIEDETDKQDLQQ